MLVTLTTVSILSPANIIIVYLNKQICVLMAQQSLQAAKTMGGPRDTRALCPQWDNKLACFMRNNILQGLHDSLVHTIAEWTLGNEILIF